jgi:hypothetical protein
MESLISAAASNWFWTVIGSIAIISVLAGTLKSVVKGWSREKSRREIAAYIASGSMTPEQGERLLKAGRKD